MSRAVIIVKMDERGRCARRIELIDRYTYLKSERSEGEEL